MENAWWIELVRGAFSATFVGAVVLGWRAIRKDRLEGRVSEHELLGTMREMMLQETQAAHAEANELRAASDRLRRRVEKLEAASATDGMLIAGLRTHIEVLRKFISEHLPGGVIPEMPHWIRDEKGTDDE